MNHDTPPFNDEACKREWLAQERALHAERLGLDPAGDDPRVRRYRMLARALRQPLPDVLPDDFAQRVAAQAVARGVRKPATDDHFEFALMIALAIAFALAAGVVVALYGRAWWPSITAILPANQPLAIRWLLAFAGCLGLSWVLAQWQQHVHSGDLHPSPPA